MASRAFAVFIITVIIAFLAYVYNGVNVPIPGPVVRISTGDIQGTLSISRGGRVFHQFRGIPYAEPPIGNLRFEPPVPKRRWDGVKDTSNFGSQCIQADLLVTSSLTGSEDCLFLNVFAPKETDFSAKPLPVFVYLHGGYFMMGGANPYTPRYFMDEDVVLVTLNHRIASLGFLNTGDGTVRGNMGLKDQTLVLLWVRDNIHKFGGNPDNVVLFGESAGASAVHFHMLSPMSAGLFHKAISQSGTANKAWSLAHQPKEQAQRLARILNCPTENSIKMVQCLKSVKAEDIISIHREANSPLRDPLYMFAPTVEHFQKEAKDTFLTELPIKLMRNGKIHRVPWMAGVNSAEGLFFSGRMMHDPQQIQELERNTDHQFPVLFCYDKNRKEVAEKIRNFYFGTTEDQPTFSFLDKLANYTDLFSDIFFIYGNREAALLHSEVSPTYLYYNNYETEFSLVDFFSIKPGSLSYVTAQVLYKKVVDWINKTVFGIHPKRMGVCHADEVLLLFQFMEMSEIGNSSKDYEMSTNLVNLWVQFANDHKKMKFFGEPWTPIKASDKPLRYMQFSNVRGENRMIDEPFTKRLDFLKTLNL